MDDVDKQQQHDIDALHQKNLEQDLRLEKIARLTDKLERSVYILIATMFLIAVAFIFLKNYAIRVDFIEQTNAKR